MIGDTFGELLGEERAEDALERWLRVHQGHGDPAGDAGAGDLYAEESGADDQRCCCALEPGT